MVFSTVQISMPGTSWANAAAAVKVKPTAVKATKAVLPAMKTPIKCHITPNCAAVPRRATDTTLIPHSSPEVAGGAGI
jgi:hypothetical protein